ncbi:MAG TPA: MarR family transcriptional regulator [Beijerinckiaceae bacterium]|nr:MarR family transcriptional regulator [Beijerinckiaceae bacterium]
MTSPAVLLTELVLETFRLNGEVLISGDRLVADLRLTSARWQVLGAIGLSTVALPVAHIARNMGLSRQAVQRLVNEMAHQGLVRLAPNPHHQRAKLVLLTAEGAATYAAAMDRQRPWVEALATGLSTEEIGAACRVLRHLRSKLRSQNDRMPEEVRNVEKLT